MLNAIAQHFKINLKGVPHVGDSLRDLQAGFVVGCKPYLVGTGNGERTFAKGGLRPGAEFLPDLAAVADYILSLPAVSTRSADNRPGDF